MDLPANRLAALRNMVIAIGMTAQFSLVPFANAGPFDDLDLLSLGNKAKSMREQANAKRAQTEQVRATVGAQTTELNRQRAALAEQRSEIKTVKGSISGSLDEGVQMIAAVSVSLKEQKERIDALLVEASSLQEAIKRARQATSRIASKTEAVTQLHYVFENFQARRELWVSAIEKVEDESSLAPTEREQLERLKSLFQSRGRSSVPSTALSRIEKISKGFSAVASSSLLEEMAAQVAALVGDLRVESSLLEQLGKQSEDLERAQGSLQSLMK